MTPSSHAPRPVRPLTVEGLLKKLRMGYVLEDSKVSGKAEIGDKPHWNEMVAWSYCRLAIKVQRRCAVCDAAPSG